MASKSIRVFFVDGTTSGLGTAEVDMTTCKAIFASRGGLAQLAKREEVLRTGVYLLVGEDPSFPGRVAVYIGEGDTVMKRLVAHDRDSSKEFWDKVIVFVSKDGSLNKAHVRYLEARLVSIAISARRATVVNIAEPVGGHLSEADSAVMEQFLENVRVLASMLGVQAFEEAAPLAGSINDGDFAVFRMNGDGYSSEMVPGDGDFVVRKGSVARIVEAPTLSPSSRALRKELETAGVLSRTEAGLTFTQDYSFRSVSGAAQLVCGANVSGNVAWKLDNGKQYKDWIESQLGTAAVAS